jgi:hypothetical protein
MADELQRKILAALEAGDLSKLRANEREECAAMMRLTSAWRQEQAYRHKGCYCMIEEIGFDGTRGRIRTSDATSFFFPRRDSERDWFADSAGQGSFFESKSGAQYQITTEILNAKKRILFATFGQKGEIRAHVIPSSMPLSLLCSKDQRHEAAAVWYGSTLTDPCVVFDHWNTAGTDADSPAVGSNPAVSSAKPRVSSVQGGAPRIVPQSSSVAAFPASQINQPPPNSSSSSAQNPRQGGPVAQAQNETKPPQKSGKGLTPARRYVVTKLYIFDKACIAAFRHLMSKTNRSLYQASLAICCALHGVQNSGCWGGNFYLSFFNYCISVDQRSAAGDPAAKDRDFGLKFWGLQKVIQIGVECFIQPLLCSNAEFGHTAPADSAELLAIATPPGMPLSFRPECAHVLAEVSKLGRWNRERGVFEFFGEQNEATLEKYATGMRVLLTRLTVGVPFPFFHLQ